MDSYTKTNKKWWNAVTPIHLRSKLYDVSNFKKGKSNLQPLEIQEIGNVKGKTLLHLMCHFGTETLSWARRGAIATGVDLSDTSINLAKKLSRETRTPATFICTDIYDLPKMLDQKFDIVFMSYGVLQWLPSMKKLAKIINQFLTKGGIFYIVEVHPFTTVLSHDFNIVYKYFETGPYVDDSSGTYTDWNEDLEGKTYEWSHTMSDVINAILSEGLQIEYVHEFPYTVYDQFPGFMEQNKKGQFVLKNKSLQVPLLFSLKAKKRK